MHYFTKIPDYGVKPNSYWQSCPTSMAYFKVKKTNPSGGIVRLSATSTRLTQKGAIHSSIPNLISQYFALPLYRNDGLLYIVNQLNEIIYASLHPVMDTFMLNRSILVSGNRGTKKTQIVRLSADHLGVHFHEVNKISNSFFIYCISCYQKY